MHSKSLIFYAVLFVAVLFAASSMAQMYELVLDNTDPDTSQYGTWNEYSMSGVHGNNTAHAKPPGSGSYYFRYPMPSGGDMALGQYNVYARWITHPALASNTKYRVYYDIGTYTDVRVNQKVNHAKWILLGTFEVAHPRPVVRVYDDADGYVQADGIRFVRVGDLSSLPSETDALTGFDADEVE